MLHMFRRFVLSKWVCSVHDLHSRHICTDWIWQLFTVRGGNVFGRSGVNLQHMRSWHFFHRRLGRLHRLFCRICGRCWL